MLTLELSPVPYPRDEHEALIVMAIYAFAWGSYLAVLIAQAIREDDLAYLLALMRYIRWRRQMRKWQRRWERKT